MRIAIVGAGIAGTLVAWRLAADLGQGGVEVWGRQDPRTDATALSFGMIRGYEANDQASALATLSLAELRGNATLRQWAGYREVGSLLLHRAAPRGEVDARVGRINHRLPGSARVVGAEELDTHYGWQAQDPAAVAVAERCAGYYSPDRLRRRLHAESAEHGVVFHDRRVTVIRPAAGSGWSVGGHDRSATYDQVVVCAGGWTRDLLAEQGLQAEPYRTKLIQYWRFSAQGESPPAFMDETSGLYGRWSADGELLLGLATSHWGVDPERPVGDGALLRDALHTVGEHMPRLTVREGTSALAGTDCYIGPPGLRLRPVPRAPALYTFSGGSGGSAKTVIAASRLAARELVPCSKGSRPWSAQSPNWTTPRTIS